MTKIAILTPVYKDWDSFEILLQVLNQLAQKIDAQITVIAVDDGSPVEMTAHQTTYSHLQHIEIIQLITNQGHQRAIARGLVELANRDFSAVIIMDCDGEDQPDYIPEMLSIHQQKPDAIIVARRKRRSEGFLFKAFYWIYKTIFTFTTGYAIDFGNYMLIPHAHIDRLTYNPNLWNHIAASVLRSGVPIHKLDTVRGKRYAGESSMNLIGLVIHGLSAVSVYIDIVLVRLLILSMGLMGLASVGVASVVIIRLFTTLAIPGWATSAVGILVLIILQMLLFSSVTAFIILNSRSRRQVIPAIDTDYVVKKRGIIFPKNRSKV